MSERDELREAVRAEYGATVSSKLVDERMRAAYESLGEMPKAKSRALRHVIKGVGTLAAACLACFLFLIVLNSVSPAMAESLPGIGGIIARVNTEYKARLTGEHLPEHVREVSIAAPVKETEPVTAEIREIYCDGIHLRLGVRYTLKDGENTEYLAVGTGDVSVQAQGLEITPGEVRRRFPEAEPGVFEGTYVLELNRAVALGFTMGSGFDGTLVLKDVRGDHTSIDAIKDQPEEGNLLAQEISIDFHAGVDVSGNRQWSGEVENENHIVLRSVISTPGTTMLCVGIPRYFNNPALTLGTGSGNLSGYSGHEDPADENGIRMESVLFSGVPDGEKLTIRVIDKNADDGVLAEFVVDLDAGTARSTGEIVLRYEEAKESYRPEAFYSGRVSCSEETPVVLDSARTVREDGRQGTEWVFLTKGGTYRRLRAEIWDRDGNKLSSRVAGDREQGDADGWWHTFGGEQTSFYQYRDWDVLLSVGESYTFRLTDEETGELLLEQTVTMEDVG